MSAQTTVKPYKRQITSMERLMARSPFAIVAMVARIKGHVTADMVKPAVKQVRQRHPHLRARLQQDNQGVLWLTSEGVGPIPVECVPRESADHWIAVFMQASQEPFAFTERPAIRFILVQSPEVSELLILCHHIICDGLSLAYLARDVMEQLGDPDHVVEVLPDALPVSRRSIPGDVSINPVVRFFINRMNKRWQRERVSFDQADYAALSAAYWRHYHHGLFSVELTAEETSALVARCRQEGVTVNSALTAAFVGAQQIVQGDRPDLRSVGVAASLRDRLQPPVGEVMGFYASVVMLDFHYDPERGFWDNARTLHEALTPRFTNKNLLTEPLLWDHLDPAILEAINFKKLGGLVDPAAPQYPQLAAFSQRDDVVLDVLKRDKQESLDRLIMGAAITNLTRMDFPTHYGPLELDRLIMHPGGAFPLVNVNLVVGAVTCSGKLSLILEYAEEAVPTSTMATVRDRALAFLQEA
ncbi:MAG: hypothetical protein JW910_16140 [Anaerolineae bacterium]|nr:hypothetical protein [Anaerolineae bacterium]